jgi:hypothetical protein
MAHKFVVGQSVVLRSAPRLSNRPSGVCRILACLPHERGPVQYRIQSTLEQVQRVVDEVDLQLVDLQVQRDAAMPDSPLTVAVPRR